MKINLLRHFIFLVFFLVSLSPLYTQTKGEITVCEGESIAKAVMREYEKFLQDNADFATRFEKGEVTESTWRKFVSSAFTKGPSRLFFNKDVKIKMCPFRGGSTSEFKIYNWLGLDPKLKSISSEIKLEFQCVYKIDQQSSTLFFKYKSIAETPNDLCANNNRRQLARKAVLKQGKDKRWYIAYLGFYNEQDEKKFTCLNTMEYLPQFDLQRPILDLLDITEATYNFKISIHNRGKSTRLYQNNQELEINKDFIIQGKVLTSNLQNLLQGDNLIRIVAENSCGANSKTINLRRPGLVQYVTPPQVIFVNPRKSPLGEAEVSESTPLITAVVKGANSREDIIYKVDGNELHPSQFKFDPNFNIFECATPLKNTMPGGKTTIYITLKKTDSIPTIGDKMTIIYQPLRQPRKDSIRLLLDELGIVQYKNQQLDSLNNYLRWEISKNNLIKDSLQVLKKKEKEFGDQIVSFKSEIKDLKYNNQKFKVDTRSRGEKVFRSFEDLDKIQKKKIEKFEKFDPNQNIFAALNYSLIKSPNLLLSPSDQFKNSIELTLEDPFLSNLNFSIYYHVGLFYSKSQKVKATLPEFHYEMRQINDVRQSLFQNQIPYQELRYLGTRSNFSAFNYGINIYTQFESLYLKIGLSKIKGSVWDVYEGEFNGLIEKNSDGTIAVDYSGFNTQKPLLGLAFVRPFFQVEGGYDFLFKDLFLNAGVNFPISDKRFRVKVRMEDGERKEMPFRWLISPKRSKKNRSLRKEEESTREKIKTRKKDYKDHAFGRGKYKD